MTVDISEYEGGFKDLLTDIRTKAWVRCGKPADKLKYYRVPVVAYLAEIITLRDMLGFMIQNGKLLPTRHGKRATGIQHRLRNTLLSALGLV